MGGGGGGGGSGFERGENSKTKFYLSAEFMSVVISTSQGSLQVSLYY